MFEETRRGRYGSRGPARGVSVGGASLPRPVSLSDRASFPESCVSCQRGRSPRTTPDNGGSRRWVNWRPQELGLRGLPASLTLACALSLAPHGMLPRTVPRLPARASPGHWTRGHVSLTLPSGALETKRAGASELFVTSRTSHGMRKRRKGSLEREMAGNWRDTCNSRLQSIGAKQTQEHLMLTPETSLAFPFRLIITCYRKLTFWKIFYFLSRFCLFLAILCQWEFQNHQAKNFLLNCAFIMLHIYI